MMKWPASPMTQVMETLIPREKLRAEVVELKGHYGVRIWAEGIHSIEVRVVGFRKFLHPDFSFNQDGTIRQAVFFPEAIAKILALEDVEAVIVNEWATNTVFGRFNPRQGYYQTNLWELVNNDSQRFAKLVEQRRIPFIGTHDVIAHLAGVLSPAWNELIADAASLRKTLEDYFEGMKLPTITSRIIPYAAGVLLDDLAQPPNFGHKGRRFVLNKMNQAIQNSKIDPAAERVLMHFPSSYEKAILLSREDDFEKIQAEAPLLIEQMEKEILEASVTFNPIKKVSPSLKVGQKGQIPSNYPGLTSN